MKVLLLGEYSGVQNNLKAGLEGHGVEVVLANIGDGFKKFSSDMLLRVDGKGLAVQLENYFLEILNLHRMKKFDVIQIMHPNTIAFYKHHNIIRLLDSAKLVVQLVGGCDYYFERYYRKIDSELCKSCKKYDRANHKCPYTWEVERRYTDEIYQRADVFVPLSWEYYFIYKNYAKKYSSKLHEMIPMPIDLKRNPYVETHNKKLQIYHPLNRVGFKGTKVIDGVFRELSEEYGERASFHIKGHMPIEQYNRYLSKMDVVIDQLYDTTYGMSALYSMAGGKIVMSGHEDERMYEDFPWLREKPTIPLGRTVAEVKESIATVILDDRVEEKKRETRYYVEKYHDARLIAQKYIQLYEKYL